MMWSDVVMSSIWEVCLIVRYRVGLLRKLARQRHKLKILRSVIASNLTSVLGGSFNESLVSGMARRNMRNHVIAGSFLDFWEYKTRCQEVEWEDYEVFEEIKKRFGSVIVCSIHSGNYYLFPFEIARKGYDTVVVVGDQHKQMGLIHIIASTLRLPVRVVKTDSSALLRLIGDLRKGSVVYVLIDELGGAVNNEKLLRVPFLGRNLQFKKGVGALQYYSGSPIVPVIASIRGENRNIIRIGKPLLHLDGAHDREKAICDTVRTLFMVFEKYVREEPDQWQKWVDFKRYEATAARGKNTGDGVDIGAANLKISKKRIRILRDGKGYVLIDMREGRYFAVDEIGQYAVKLMYRINNFMAITDRVQKKFNLSADAATDCVRRIAAIGME